MTFDETKLAVLLYGFEKMIRRTAKKHPSFKERLKEKNFTAQLKVKDNSVGRYFRFNAGRVSSKRGTIPNPDVCMTFNSAALAVRLLGPWRDPLDLINVLTQ